MAVVKGTWAKLLTSSLQADLNQMYQKMANSTNHYVEWYYSLPEKAYIFNCKGKTIYVTAESMSSMTSKDLLQLLESSFGTAAQYTVTVTDKAFHLVDIGEGMCVPSGFTEEYIDPKKYAPTTMGQQQKSPFQKYLLDQYYNKIHQQALGSSITPYKPGDLLYHKGPSEKTWDNMAKMLGMSAKDFAKMFGL